MGGTRQHPPELNPTMKTRPELRNTNGERTRPACRFGRLAQTLVTHFLSHFPPQNIGGTRFSASRRKPHASGVRSPGGRAALDLHIGARAKTLVLLPALLCLSATPLFGQGASPAEIESLKKQLLQAQDAFDKAMREQRQVIDSMSRKIQELEAAQRGPGGGDTNPLPVIAAPPGTVTSPQVVTTAASMPAPPPSPAATAAVTPAPWSPTDPIRIGRAGQAYLDLGFDALIDAGWSTASDPGAYLNLGGHDPRNRGFSIPDAEISIVGAVDPYFKAIVDIGFSVDGNGDTGVELEDAYMMTTALPWNFQARAGELYANFGRLNPQHAHAWDFVDQPIILNRTLGPDGLRNPGAQINWLAPLPVFTELSLGIFNGAGETAFSYRNLGEEGPFGATAIHGRRTRDYGLSGPGDMLYVPRLAVSFDLTPNQTVVTGVSAGFGANDTGPSQNTQVYGFDLYWKWKSPRADKGFPFVSWQTEGAYQIFGAGANPVAGLPSENLRDYGFYSQVLWGFKPRWVVGLRGEWANGNQAIFDPNDAYRGERIRVSPNLTWYVTEFSKVRLQYNYDYGHNFGVANSVWLQLEFLLGAHAAHRF